MRLALALGVMVMLGVLGPAWGTATWDAFDDYTTGSVTGAWSYEYLDASGYHSMQWGKPNYAGGELWYGPGWSFIEKGQSDPDLRIHPNGTNTGAPANSALVWTAPQDIVVDLLLGLGRPSGDTAGTVDLFAKLYDSSAGTWSELWQAQGITAANWSSSGLAISGGDKLSFEVGAHGPDTSDGKYISASIAQSPVPQVPPSALVAIIPLVSVAVRKLKRR